MRPSFILLISALLLCSLNSSAQETKKSFRIDGDSLYTFRFFKKSDHFIFSLCKPVESGNDVSCNEKKSQPLIKEMTEDDFNNEFDRVAALVAPGSARTINKPTPLSSSSTHADSVTFRTDSIKHQKYVAERKQLYTGAREIVEEKTTQEKVIESLRKRIGDLENEKPNNVPTGEIRLKKLRPPVRTASGKSFTGEDTSRTIESITINTYNGSISKRGMVVEMTDGTTFTNLWSPLSLARYRKSTTRRLYMNNVQGQNSKQFIELGDVILFRDFGMFYYPSNDQLSITEKKQRDTFRIGSALNQLINVSVYTDLLGLLNRKPNGIIQTEVNAHIISNTASIRGTDIILHNYIEPYVRLVKYDSRFAQLDSNFIKFNRTEKESDTISRTYLNQIPYLTAGLKTNVIRFGLGVNQEIYLNLGYEIGLVNADSLYKKDITFFNWYPEFEYKIRRFKNFGMDAYIKLLRQRVADSAPFINRSGVWIFNPQISLYYYPVDDESKKIYLRFIYFDNLSNDGKYNFSQFQFGYKTNLKFNNK